MEAPKQEDNHLQEQFQRAAKQEKYISEERRKIEEAKKAFESDRSTVDTYKRLKDKDPFEILEHFGITYDKLLEADNQRRTSPTDPVAKKALETVEQLRMELENERKANKQEQHTRAETKLMADIDSAIKVGEFDLIDGLGEQSAVRARMEEMYDETGEIPDIAKACEDVTARLVEKFSKIKGSKWLQPKEEPKEEPKSKLVETLTNKMSQTTTSSDKPASEHERRQASLEIIRKMTKK